MSEDPSISNIEELTEGSSIELVLPVIDESHMQNCTENDYFIMGDSNGEYVSTLILQHLSERVTPSENVNKNHEDIPSNLNTENNDNKTLDLGNITHLSEEHLSNMVTQINPLNHISQIEPPKKFEIDDTETNSASTSYNDLKSNMPEVDFYVSSSVLNSDNALEAMSSKYNGNTSEKLESNTTQYSSRNRNSTSTLLEAETEVNNTSSSSKFWNTNDNHTSFYHNDFDQNFETKFQQTSSEISNVDKSNQNSDHSKPAYMSPFVKKNNPKPRQFCPQCKSNYSEDRELKYFQVSLDSSILLCSSKKCTYPFDTPNEILNIKTQPIDEVLQSEIDFDISNISINTRDIDEQILKLQNDIIQPFLCSFDELKINFERLQAGDFRNVEDTGGDNNLITFINEALASNQDDTSQGKCRNLKLEPCVEIKPDNSEDIDRFIEEQNEDIQRMMLEHFI